MAQFKVMSRRAVMNQTTAEHFYRWLTETVFEDEQHQVEQDIHALLREYPELVQDRSWPEMRRLAERMASHK